MALSLKPGLVWGTAYADLIRHCKETGFALPAVNVVGTNSLNAVLEAAAKYRSDVIVQLSNGGARFFAGQGLPDAHTAMVVGAVSAARHAALLAEHYGICVILHTDHANRPLLRWVEDLVGYSERSVAETGAPVFSSHMLDLSEEPITDNLATCERTLARMAGVGLSLEIELGVTGGEEDGVGLELDAIDNARLYTQPEDVLAAYDRLAPVGRFSVAASFGNVHGVYKPGNVKLRPEILKASQELVARSRGLGPKPLDLVFHGGSGSELSDIQTAVSYGVFKMNIDTDTQFAFAEPVGRYVGDNAAAFRHQIDLDTGKPYKSAYDPRKWLRAGELGMVERLGIAFEQLGSARRSVSSAMRSAR
jgi:fructose-bisphosphate aldolase class II